MLDFFPRGDIVPGPGVPKKLEECFNGSFVYEGKSLAATARLVDFMGNEWVKAWERRPEVFEELFRSVKPAGDWYDEGNKAAKRFFRFFTRQAESAGLGVAEFVFDVDPRHSEAFAVESHADFAAMLVLREVPVELVLELREVHGRLLRPVLGSAFGTGRYKPWNAAHARRLCQMATGSRFGYPLMRAGVPGLAVKALEGLDNRDEAHDAVTEAAFLGVPAAYGVAVVLQGVLNPDLILDAFKTDIAPEYVGAVS